MQVNDNWSKFAEINYMNFQLTEEQSSVRDVAREFAQKICKPGVIQRDTHMAYPHEEVKKMAELGFMGMMVDPQFGGGGLDTLSYVVAMEEISKVDNSCSVIMSVNNSLVCWAIDYYGSEFQKSKYLPLLSSGQWIGSFCLSEPEAGSDATHQRTQALDRGDHYLLNGTKNWITNGSTSNLHIVIAQSDSEKGTAGINAFLVEAAWEGVKIGAKEDKLGIRSSDTTSITYNDVKVPKENKLGREGEGFKIAMKILDGGRIGIAAQALGISCGAYELALAYSKEREAFGKPISHHQGVSFKLAQMATNIEAAKLMVYRAAHLKDEGLAYSTASAMAKLFASEVAMKTTIEAVQIHGGYGFVKEYHVERLLRDAKITQIYEGTSEIQQIVISRAITQGNPYLPD
jgi:alkylation response protein AidB-like acyl-CoA dehydrogenase